ncbi:ABC transporter substrate-binding protein [Desulfolithobacter sp.]
MRKRHCFLLLLTPLLLALALPPGSALAKDTLTLALRGEPADGFDPLMGWGRYGNPLFQSTLLKYDNDLNIVNDLATGYTVARDGLTWTVTIRRDARFSDGTPLKAEDVAFTFNKAKTSRGKVDLTQMKEAVVTAPDTIEFHFERPDSTFIHKLLTLGIVPQHLYGDGYGRNPVGSGPFKMISWVEGEQMSVEPNPYYYGKPSQFKKITFLYGKEDTMFAAAKAGKVDVVVVPAHLGHQKIKGMHVKAVKSVDNRGLMFPVVPDEGKKTATGAPIGNNVTADIAIRKAINMAIDRKMLVEGVLYGYGRPAYFVCDNLAWDNPANRIKDGDPEGARKLLESAGWKDIDGDGVREKNGLKAEFTIIYPADRSIRQGLALACADMLREIGIKANVVGKSWDEIKGLRHANVIVYGWGAHNPIELYSLYHSKNAGQGHTNAGFYNNPKVDEYLEKAINAPSFADSLQWWKKAQWDGETGAGPRGDAPWAWLVNLDHVYFVSDKLDIGKSRIEPHGHGWPLTANITEWKLVD